MFVTKKLREQIDDMDRTIRNQASTIRALTESINMLTGRHSKYQKGDILKYDSYLEYGGVKEKISLVDKVEASHGSIMYIMENGEYVREPNVLDICVCKKSKKKKEG